MSLSRFVWYCYEYPIMNGVPSPAYHLHPRSTSTRYVLLRGIPVPLGSQEGAHVHEDVAVPGQQRAQRNLPPRARAHVGCSAHQPKRRE